MCDVFAVVNEHKLCSGQGHTCDFIFNMWYKHIKATRCQCEQLGLGLYK